MSDPGSFSPLSMFSLGAVESDSSGFPPPRVVSPLDLYRSDSPGCSPSGGYSDYVPSPGASSVMVQPGWGPVGDRSHVLLSESSLRYNWLDSRSSRDGLDQLHTSRSPTRLEIDTPSAEYRASNDYSELYSTKNRPDQSGESVTPRSTGVRGKERLTTTGTSPETDPTDGAIPCPSCGGNVPVSPEQEDLFPRPRCVMENGDQEGPDIGRVWMTDVGDLAASRRSYLEALRQLYSD